MKKLPFGLILSALFFIVPSSAFASVTFSPVSPQPASTVVTVTLSSGNYFQVFDASGANGGVNIGSDGSNGTGASGATFVLGATGSYKVVESNTGTGGGYRPFFNDTAGFRTSYNTFVSAVGGGGSGSGLDATTTAVFASAGISPALLSGSTGLLTVIFNQALFFMIYIVQTVWPFLLVLGLIGVIVSVAYAMLHKHR